MTRSQAPAPPYFTSTSEMSCIKNVSHMNESCLIHEHVTSNLLKESCPICSIWFLHKDEQVVAQIAEVLVLENESCLIYERVMSHI